MSIVDELKFSFKHGSMLTKLIYINLIVFLAVKIIEIISFLFNIGSIENSFLVNWLAVPADLSVLITKPWTIFTYMFLHQGFLHILFNMLWLYWFGKIFLQYFNEKQMLNVYILGGLFGGALFIIAFNFFPAFQNSLPLAIALGASASVLAVVIAISVYVPNYTLYLAFIGQIKLKYIALVTILVDILSLAGDNSGGHIAHLGGALFGYVFVMQYKKGKQSGIDFAVFFTKIVDFFKPKPKIRVTHKKPKTDIEYNVHKAGQQKEMDRILDKIAKGGYESLTKKEKEILFNISNK